MYLGTSPQLEPTTALFILYYKAVLNNYESIHLQKQGWGGPPIPPAQRASTSESHACTSTAVSCGNPDSCRVKCTGEQPPTVVSESNSRSSKVRGFSSSIIDPHSHGHHHLCGSASRSVCPCLSPAPPDDGSEFASPVLPYLWGPPLPVHLPLPLPAHRHHPLPLPTHLPLSPRRSHRASS